MAGTKRKKTDLAPLTDEQKVFLQGRRWSRNAATGLITVVVEGPLHGAVPTGISVVTPRVNREVRRHQALRSEATSEGIARSFIPDPDRPQGSPSSLPARHAAARRPSPSGQVQRVTPAYYTIGRIEHHLRNWELLCQLAESPATSRQHVDPQHQKPGATPTDPRSGKRGRGAHADPMKFADIQADLERAAQALPESLGRRAVLERMRAPASLRTIAARLHAGHNTTADAYAAALAAMSTMLEPDAGAER